SSEQQGKRPSPGPERRPACSIWYCRRLLQEGLASAAKMRPWWAAHSSEAVILPIPVHEPRHAFVDADARQESQVAGGRRDVGEAGPRVARLHRRQLDRRLAPHRLLDQLDQPAQRLAAMVAEIVKPVWRLARGTRRRPVEGGDHAGDDVVDIGEVALHLALVEEGDRPALEDGFGEDE